LQNLKLTAEILYNVHSTTGDVEINSTSFIIIRRL